MLATVAVKTSLSVRLVSRTISSELRVPDAPVTVSLPEVRGNESALVVSVQLRIKKYYMKSII